MVVVWGAVDRSCSRLATIVAFFFPLSLPAAAAAASDRTADATAAAAAAREEPRLAAGSRARCRGRGRGEQQRRRGSLHDEGEKTFSLHWRRPTLSVSLCALSRSSPLSLSFSQSVRPLREKRGREGERPRRAIRREREERRTRRDFFFFVFPFFFSSPQTILFFFIALAPSFLSSHSPSPNPLSLRTSRRP